MRFEIASRQRAFKRGDSLSEPVNAAEETDGGMKTGARAMAWGLRWRWKRQRAM